MIAFAYLEEAEIHKIYITYITDINLKPTVLI